MEIREKGQEMWKNGMRCKKTLNVYRNKCYPSVEEFYVGDFKSQLLFKARTGSLELNGRIYRWSGKSEKCEWCDMGVKENIEHLIMECNGHKNERVEMLERVKDLIGEDKMNDIKRKEDRGMSVLLGFKCVDKEINAFRVEIVDAVKMFLLKVWSKR